MVGFRRCHKLARVSGRLLIALALLIWAPHARADGDDAAAPADDAAPPEEPARQDMLGAPAPEEEAGPNHGRLSFSATSDFTTAYVFRGIVLEKDGFIWQPAASVSLEVYKGDGFLQSASLDFGIWNSVQSKQTGASGSGPSNLYETDYYPGVTLAWEHGFETSLTYTIYTSPNGAFLTTQELDLGLSYDDSELLGAYALHPEAVFAFELENTSFGNDKGDYFELKVEPGIDLSLPFDPAGDYPVTTSFPVAVGLSMNDYYEDGAHNQTFGFLSFGLGASVPLSFVPKDFGAWSIGAAINVYYLSQTLKPLAGDNSMFPVGTGSISFEY